MLQSLLVVTNNMELQVEYDSHCQLRWTRSQFPYLQDKVLISPDDKKNLTLERTLLEPRYFSPNT